MSFIDDTMLNLKSIVSKVSQKAENAIDGSKFKHAEEDINKEISQKLEELGLFVYESTIMGDIDKDKLKNYISDITDTYKQLDNVRAMIAKCKSRQLCPSCGNLNEEGSVFCNRCGSKFQEETIKAEEPVINKAQEVKTQENNIQKEEKVENVVVKTPTTPTTPAPKEVNFAEEENQIFSHSKTSADE